MIMKPKKKQMILEQQMVNQKTWKQKAKNGKKNKHLEDCKRQWGSCRWHNTSWFCKGYLDS